MPDDQAERADRTSTPGRSRPQAEVERRRRLDEVFGDVLPDTTGDERDEPGAGGEASDRWLREQVPPHHG